MPENLETANLDIGSQNVRFGSEAITKSKQNCSVNTIVLLLLFVAVGAAGFFGYKYFQLLGTTTTLPTKVASDEMTPVTLPTSVPTPTPAPTLFASDISGWKTYLDSTHQVSIDYPGDWYPPEVGNPTQFFNYDVAKAPGRSFDSQLDRGMLKIEIYFSGDTATLKEYVENYIETTYGSDTNEKLNNVRMSNGQQAMQLGSAYFVRNPYTQENIILSFGLDFNNYRQLRDKILSTFKFIGDDGADLKDSDR